MKKIFLTLFLLLPLFFINANPINALLDRIDDGLSKKFILIIEKNSKEDYFKIWSKNNKIIVKANNYPSMGVGINWYLKYYANVHLSWDGMKAKLPQVLPIVHDTVHQSTSQTLRYQFNYCTYGYSMSFWDWDRWQQELDWLLLHGINTPLMMVGLESVWKTTLIKLGYSAQEINKFISGPAFLPWWAMNNLEGWGGPLPESWYVQQEILKTKILSRMKEFGMTPVLPGYAGMIPSNAKKKLGYNISDPGWWCGFKRPAFLQPCDSNFSKVAQLYYKELNHYYGKSKYYSIDPFHEGGNIDGVDLSQTGKNILREMKKNNPQSVWIIQAWQANPRSELIDGLPKGDLLILDLWCECRPQWGDKESLWYRENGFGKHEWLYCSVLNFGNNVGLYGKIDRIVSSFDLARQHPNGKALKGIGMTMEGIENNPIMFELFFELPWHKSKIDTKLWIDSYALYRYGKENTLTKQAWQILSKTAYNCPTIQEGTSESIFCARPDTIIEKVSCCSLIELYYDPKEVEKAAKLLLDASSIFKSSNHYQYDVVDIVRQCLTNKGRALYRSMIESYQNRDKKQYDNYSLQFLELILDQDKLLSTRKEFMLATWLEKAKSKATNKRESALYEWNARTIITTWGNRNSSEEAGLKNYSHREWSGMLRDFYYPKWEKYLSMLSNNLTGAPIQAIDFYEWEERWNNQTNTFTTEPIGDPIVVAKEMFQKHIKTH